MTTPNLADLLAQQQTLQDQIDAAQVTPLRGIAAAFDAQAVKNAVKTVRDNIDQLTGDRRQQAQNILTVLDHSPAFLGAEADAIEARLNPPSGGEGAV